MEQGPVLEGAGRRLGPVAAIAGQSRLQAEIVGEQARWGGGGGLARCRGAKGASWRAGAPGRCDALRLPQACKSDVRWDPSLAAPAPRPRRQAQGHAGTVPMQLRRDPLAAAAEVIGLLERSCNGGAHGQPSK